MLLELSLTTVIIVVAIIGGVLVLGAIIATILLVRRHRRRRNLQRSEERQTSAGERWGSNGVLRDQSMTECSLAGRLYRKPSQAVSQYPRDSWLRPGLLPSRQNLAASSNWAVQNGSYVPRPHRLKKSKSSIIRESVLLDTIPNGGVRPMLSRTTTEASYGDGSPKRSHTTRGRRARLSTKSGKAHLMSIVMTPEHHSHHGDIRETKIDPGRKNKWANLRQSLVFSIKSRSPSKSPRTSRRIVTPGTNSTSKPSYRRSLSVPYIPPSHIPSQAVPAVPTPSNVPRLLNVQKARQPHASPSKESVASHSSKGSSIFDGLSPNLKQDLRELCAGLKRPESRRTIKRRSSAPSLPIKRLLFDRYEDINEPARKTSAASSQLLPSPVKPVMRSSEAMDQASIYRPIFAKKADLRESQGSSDGSKLRARDVHIRSSSPSADWDVFGPDKQTSSTRMENGNEQAEMARESSTLIDTTERNSNGVPTPLRKPRVLQKKWKKQEDYLPLAFASVAYNSTTRSNTPIILPSTFPAPSSVYSDPVTQPQDEGIGKATGQRSVTEPQPKSHWSSSSLVFEPPPIEHQRASSPYPRSSLFGPRRMPSITSQMSLKSPILSDHTSFQRPPSRLSYHATSLPNKQQNIPFNSKSQSAAFMYPSEELSSDDENEPVLPFINPPSRQSDQNSNIDPPPVRLQPTPLRKSFYGYEAVPSFGPPGSKKTSTTNQPTGKDVSEQALTMLPRPWSRQSYTAPRPPSCLSDSFRLSASFMNNRNNNRNSDRDSLVLPSSPPLEATIRNLRPLSYSSVPAPLTSKDTRRPISVTSMILQSDQSSSTSVTPLKHYNEFCDLFPKPLSISSDSRPPTWVITDDRQLVGTLPEQTELNHPVAAKRVPRGLPPNPRYFLDQRSGEVSKSQQPTRTEDKAIKSSQSTTGKHSPLRRSIVHRSTGSIHTPATTITQHPSVIPTPQAGTPLTIKIVNCLRRDNSSPYSELDRMPSFSRKSLNPISVNTRGPRPFTSAGSKATASSAVPRPGSAIASRSRSETSPSPSSRRSQGISNGDTNTKQRPKTAIQISNSTSQNDTPRQTSERYELPDAARKPSTNFQLKQRIEDAKRRKVLGHQQQQQQQQPLLLQDRQMTQTQVVIPEDEKENRLVMKRNDNSSNNKQQIRPIGLGITIPTVPPVPVKRKADSTIESGYSSAGAVDGSNSGSKRRRNSPSTMLISGQTTRSQSRPSPSRLPSPRRVRFSETSRVFGDSGSSSGRGDGNGNGRGVSQGVVYATSFRKDGSANETVKRMSSSSGRIWREEVF